MAVFLNVVGNRCSPWCSVSFGWVFNVVVMACVSNVLCYVCVVVSMLLCLLVLQTWIALGSLVVSYKYDIFIAGL